MDDTQGSVFPKLAEMTHRTSENAYLYAVGRVEWGFGRCSRGRRM
jgi:hypothetical protein